MRPLQHAIVGYLQDEDGNWTVELACGHRRHVRHEPPFQESPWILDEESRRRHLGTLIECGICRQATERVIPGEGGEAACFAHVLCPDCGAVLNGGEHRPGCTWRD